MPFMEEKELRKKQITRLSAVLDFRDSIVEKEKKEGLFKTMTDFLRGVKGIENLVGMNNDDAEIELEKLLYAHEKSVKTTITSGTFGCFYFGEYIVDLDG